MDDHQIPGSIYGVDLTSTDGKATPPQVISLDDNPLHWFTSAPTDPAIAIRIFCVSLRPEFECSPSAIAKLLTTPPLDKVVAHAIWASEIYHSLVANPGGGAVELLDEPYRFILRTPDDGGPFCSFAASHHRRVVKAIYLFNNAAFDPKQSSGSGSEQSLSAWKASGLQMTSLAHRVVRVQSSSFTSPALASVITSLSDIEARLGTTTSLPRNHPLLSQTLHKASRSLIDIERRSRFEDQVLASIEKMATHAPSDTRSASWPAIQSQRMTCEARSYDFSSLPQRIANARAELSARMQQRNEQLNLELAQSSERIAEATFADSKSMKTIAVLTMVFLPGTAVASLFSMGMFDWFNNEGAGGLASKWLWVYFVVSVPLTGVVLAVWWVWGKRVEERARRIYAQREVQRGLRFVDVDADAEEGSPGGDVDETGEIELQTARPDRKVNDGSEV